jgi:hypothetical protein
VVAYRFYLVDRRGHFRGAEIIEAADDEAARLQAAELKSRLGVSGYELWDQARRVDQQLADGD